MKYINLVIGLIFSACSIESEVEHVTLVTEDSGTRLVVNGNDFMIAGMNWDYFPIGTNYSYILWEQPEEFIISALDSEMKLLKEMGVNTIRVYTGIPPQWIQYIYENYGIHTMLNHSFGRYGLTLQDEWVPNTNYADPKVKEVLMEEIRSMVNDYKGTPGLLLYLLGNENNYGLFWEGAETEDIPIGDQASEDVARSLYKRFNEATLVIKSIDNSLPVAICNGDLLYLDLIADECQDIDVLGTNMYRGESFSDAFIQVKEKLNKPILFTEFGADAYNTLLEDEDQESQAYYMLNNWKEIYQNAAGLGLAGNAIGGFTFQFSDGWWKHGQTERLDIHDTNASWSNGGYDNDYVEGKNNMNEEWFGICAKSEADVTGLYKLQPRLSYYVLKEAHKINPFDNQTSVESINSQFEAISLANSINAQ